MYRVALRGDENVLKSITVMVARLNIQKNELYALSKFYRM